MRAHSEKLRLAPLLGIAAVLLLAVVLPRLAAMGDFIYLDEGYHDYMARFINLSLNRGEGFPKEIIGYKLFPVLFSWVWNLPGNGTVWLRLADLLFATACGGAFCLLLACESKSWLAGLLLALACFTGMNLDQAIDSGFKNSFFPAFLCLFLALYISKDAPGKSWRWWLAGALTATGILFRETFFLFPVIGFLALAVTRNYSSLWRYTLGGVAAAAAITLVSAIARGQIWGIFEFYFIYGKIYGPEEGLRWPKFISNGSRAITFYLPIVLLTIGSLWLCRRRLCIASRGTFWLACALAPLLEPMAKIGFLYHFSACLPGLAGFCAWAYTIPKSPKLAKYWLTAMGLCAIAMQPLMYAQYAKLPTTLKALRHWPKADWPVQQSNTLLAAEAIHKLLPPGGTVASTGFAYFIFPASQSEPPQMALADLSRTYIFAGYDKNEFLKRFNANPPDLVLLSYASDEHIATFYNELNEIMAHHPDYTYVAEIPPNPGNNYGWLGYKIYKKSSKPE